MRRFIVLVLCFYSLEIGAREMLMPVYPFMEPTSVTTPLERLQNAAIAYQNGAYDVAFDTLKPLAENGSADAQNYLGYMYLTGEGTLRNQKEAAYWFLEAAKSGLPSAQNNIAYLYYNGIGIKKSETEAFYWYKKAAAKGLTQAETSLGIIHETSTSKKLHSPELALRWYLKAAKKRDTVAQYSLGHMFYQGIGTPKNFIEAYRWLYLAGASQNLEKIELISAVTKEREAVSLEISPEGMEKALHLALQWSHRYPVPPRRASRNDWKTLGTTAVLEMARPSLDCACDNKLASR